MDPSADTSQAHLARFQTIRVESLSYFGNTPKNAPSVEWNYVHTINGEHYDCKCKYYGIEKASGATHTKGHFFGGPKYTVKRCTHLDKDRVAKSLRDDKLRDEQRKTKFSMSKKL